MAEAKRGSGRGLAKKDAEGEIHLRDTNGLGGTWTDRIPAPAVGCIEDPHSVMQDSCRWAKGCWWREGMRE